MTIDVLIIGGGPAGLAAAVGAYEAGCTNILILERESYLGGILNQCIHNGFGLHTFNEELTGPEYADRFVKKVQTYQIPYLLDTMVLTIGNNKVVYAVNEAGVLRIKAKSIVLCMGCRERPRGALNIPGTRPAGVFTAGTAQKFVNIDGYLPGKEVVILGSGDIGLIMARRMILEGAKVHCVAELLPYSGGLKRNIVQCLDDFQIPLYYSHTVAEIIGKKRVEAVALANVDASYQVIETSKRIVPCDTLLLSVGLIPENDLSKQAGVKLSNRTKGPVVNECFETTIAGIFACGNVLHVHDLVDFVSEESTVAGRHAAEFAKKPKEEKKSPSVEMISGNGISYLVPFFLSHSDLSEDCTLRFRVNQVFKNYKLRVYFDEQKVFEKRKLIFTPGEMEQITLTRSMLAGFPSVKKIKVCLEEVI